MLQHSGLCCQGLCCPQETPGAPPTRAGRTVQSLGRWVQTQLLPYFVIHSFRLPFPHLGNADRHPSIYQGRGWNHEFIEGLSLGTCGTARMVWRCRCCYCCPHTVRFALPCGFAHSLGPYAERWTGRQTNWTDPCTPQPNGSGLRRPNPGPGYSGGLSQPGARRASRRRRRSAGRDWPDVRTAPFGHARAPSCARTRSLPRTRVLRAPCSGLRARRFQAGPAGGRLSGAGR